MKRCVYNKETLTYGLVEAEAEVMISTSMTEHIGLIRYRFKSVAVDKSIQAHKPAYGEDMSLKSH